MLSKLKGKYNIEFFWVCFIVGLSVLFYRGSMESIATFIGFFIQIFAESLQGVALNIVNYSYQIVVSVISFGIGAVTFIGLISIGKRDRYKPVYAKFRHPFLAVFFIIATVAINYAAAQVNAMIINLLAPDAVQMAGETAMASMTWVDIVLLFLSTAVVPGIVEEIMFRGLILTNLTPYGRGMAIVTSALLFGLMHMNPQQFFYTTLMGVILGLVYVKTKSIWICIAIHFTNNALACLQEVFFGCMGYDLAVRCTSVLMILVMSMGLISVIVLFAAERINRKNAPEEIGSFGRICEPDISYEERPVSRKGKVLLFFSSTNTVFAGWVFIMMFLMAGAMMLAGLLYSLLGLFGIF